MKRKLIIGGVSLSLLVIGGLGYGVNYLFNYAVVASEKDFINKLDDAKLAKEWEFSEGKTTTEHLTSRDGLDLQARFIKHEEKTNKVAIVAHGYMGKGLQMGNYSSIFYDEGFDIVVPDNRAHGESEGEYIGFGWLDRLDYLDWIDIVIDQYGEDVEIALFGISMGASTVMMLSGEELPKQVKLIIEDCGYDSVENELAFQLKDMFNLPKFPMLPLASWYTDLKAGYNFEEASALKQVAKNNLPMLFIHGSADDFVPTEMVYSLYEATKGPKELIIFEGSGHAKSLEEHPKEYREAVVTFLDEYFPK